MSFPNQSRRLVLDSSFTRQEFHDLIARSGWQFLYSIPAGVCPTNEWVWRIDSEHAFHYFECTNYPVQYCMIVGARPNEMLMLVSTELEFLDVDDLIRAFDLASEVGEKKVTAFALGVGASEKVESDIYTRIRAALNDPLSEIRLAGIDASFVTEWEIFRADFERLAATDHDPVVRQTASNALSEVPKPKLSLDG